MQVLRSGFWTVGRWRGVPIRLHWSIAAGAFVFGWFRFVPGVWLGFLLLVLVHELGHAALARARRLRVHEVQVHGLGGVCVHDRAAELDGAIIAWGGVLAQLLVLLGPTLLIVQLWPPTSLFAIELAHALIVVNLWIAALNLLPIPPLDGARAWRLPQLWWRRRAGRRRRAQTPPTRSKVAKPSERRAPASAVASEDPAEVARRLAREALEAARRRD